MRGTQMLGNLRADGARSVHIGSHSTLPGRDEWTNTA